ncbi:MAG TPA: hypothetical protein V6D07_18740 [Trichocoleus sp.]
MATLNDFLSAKPFVSQVGLSWGVPEITLSNNVADSANFIDFTAGSAVVSNGTDRITVTGAARTKSLNAFATANNGGSLDTGTKTNSTWYHAYLIYNSTTKEVAHLFSLSATAPTMPSGFTYKRRIGAIQTQSNGVIRPFLHHASRQLFEWITVVYDMVDVDIAVTDTLYTFTVPTGVPVRMLGRNHPGTPTSNGGELFIMMRTPGTVLNTDSLSSYAYLVIPPTAEFRVMASIQVPWITNNAAQLMMRRLGSYGGSAKTHHITHGWEDISILLGA